MPIDLPEGVYSGFSIYGNDVFVPGINSLGEHWSSPRLKQESKKLKNYTLLLQLEGECSFNINGKREELSNGNLLLISSGAIMERLEQRYSYNHCLWIGFSMRQALQDEPELLKDWDEFTRVDLRVVLMHITVTVSWHFSTEPILLAFLCYVGMWCTHSSISFKRRIFVPKWRRFF